MCSLDPYPSLNMYSVPYRRYLRNFRVKNGKKTLQYHQIVSNDITKKLSEHINIISCGNVNIIFIIVVAYIIFKFFLILGYLLPFIFFCV